MGARILQTASGEGAEHENSATEGSIARKTFAANTFQAGQLYEFSAAVVVNDNNSTDTLTLAVRFGDSSTVTDNDACGTSAAVDVADADFAVIHGFIAVQSSTRAVVYGFLSAADAANVEKACAFYKVVAIDPAAPHYLDITADWSAAHADNEVAAAHFHVRELT